MFEPLGGGVGVIDFDLDGELDFHLAQAGNDAASMMSVIDPVDGTLRLPGPLHFNAAADRIAVSVGDSTATTTWLPRGTGLGGLGHRFGWPTGQRDPDRQREDAELFLRLRKSPSSGEIKSSRWIDIAGVSGTVLASDGLAKACMGIAAADFDGDGRIDLYVTNYTDEWNHLFIQTKPGMFIDRAVAMDLDRISNPMQGFGTQALDYDRNGTMDLIVANGHIEDLRDRGVAFRMPTQLLGFDGKRFGEMTVRGDDYWDRIHLGRGVAVADFDRDGRIDVAITDLAEPFRLMATRTPPAMHFIEVELVGRGCERDAIGASVSIGDRTAWMTSGDGYLCKNESVLFITVDSGATTCNANVHWPDGTRQIVTGLPVNSRVLVVQDDDDLSIRWTVDEAD